MVFWNRNIFNVSFFQKGYEHHIYTCTSHYRIRLVWQRPKCTRQKPLPSAVPGGLRPQQEARSAAGRRATATPSHRRPEHRRGHRGPELPPPHHRGHRTTPRHQGRKRRRGAVGEGDQEEKRKGGGEGDEEEKGGWCWRKGIHRGMRLAQGVGAWINDVDAALDPRLVLPVDRPLSKRGPSTVQEVRTSELSALCFRTSEKNC